MGERWSALAEPFSQWVIRTDCANGRPPLEKVRAQFAADLTRMKLAKLRLLSASHCAGNLATWPVTGLPRGDGQLAYAAFAGRLTTR
jgi:Mannitol dehydrogenase C-terminal domain